MCRGWVDAEEGGIFRARVNVEEGLCIYGTLAYLYRLPKARGSRGGFLRTGLESSFKVVWRRVVGALLVNMSIRMCFVVEAARGAFPKCSAEVSSLFVSWCSMRRKSRKYILKVFK